ncbi:MAG: phage terminase small subunit P27 family [Planctomycetota bacterium]
MGTRGPIPMTEAVARRRGTYRKDRHRKVALGCPKGSVRMPARIGNDERVRAVWEELAPGLIELGLLTPLDESMFEIYCHNVAMSRMASEHLAVEGLVKTTPRGRQIPNPWFRIEKVATSMILKIAPHFGLTPVSRARLGPVMKPGPTAEDPKDRFFSKGLP